MKSHLRAGFTLLELMVVIILIGILTAVILPEMKGTYEDALLRAASRNLVSACDLASSHAISANCAQRLLFNPKTGHYLIQRRAGEREPEGNLTTARELPGGDGEVDSRIAVEIHKAAEGPVPVRAEEGGGFTDTLGPAAPRDDGITFYPDGTADPSVIVLRDREGFGLALRINPVTARVRIVELARE